MRILGCMEMILVCKQCGYEEHGHSERALMTKIRMLNHLNREHPGVVEPFTESVEQMQPASH